MALTVLPNPNRPFPFSRLRQSMLAGALQEGVVNAGDLKVTQRAAGAQQNVDIAAGGAFIQTDVDAPDGLAYAYNDAAVNVAVAASNATLPRIDQVVLRYNDTSAGTGAGDDPTITVLTGTATTGATLDNRTGTAAIPNDAVRLADILVPAASTSVTTANIRDRRPWARGVRWSYSRTAGNFGGSVGFTIIDTNMQPRIECSGSEMMFSSGLTYQADAAARTLSVRVLMDGVSIIDRDVTVPASGLGTVSLNDPYTPPAGSHVFQFQFATGTAAGTTFAVAGQPVTASIQETVRQNASNS